MVIKEGCGMALVLLPEHRAELNENSCKLRNVEFQVQTSKSKKYWNTEHTHAILTLPSLAAVQSGCNMCIYFFMGRTNRKCLALY